MQVDESIFPCYTQDMKKRKPGRHPDLNRVLTVPEIAAMKEVAETTVTRAIEDGELSGEKRTRVWLVAREDAEAWIPRRQLQQKIKAERLAAKKAP